MVTEDGDMSVFGGNSHGELGLGHQLAVKHPTLLDKLAFGGHDVVMASAGATHSACVTSTGTLWMWGSDFGGALGIPQEDEDVIALPTQVFAQIQVLMVACGSDFTMVLTRTKHVWSCGRGGHGQLGHNDKEDRKSFTQIDHQLFGPAATVSMIAVGFRHSMALTMTAAGSTLWTWGSKNYGMLGYEDTGNKHLVPTPTPAATFDGMSVVSMDGGVAHTLVVTADGSLWGCGSDTFGQLGLHKDSTAAEVSICVRTFQKVAGSDFAHGHGILMAACGFFHSVVIAKNKTVWVCGANKNGSDVLTSTRSLTAIDPALFGDSEILVVAAGRDTCGVVTEDGRVWMWDGIGNRNPVYAPALHARTGRWHNLRPDHALAFVMMSHKRLGADALCFEELFPSDVFQSILAYTHLEPRADTPHGLHDRMGRRPR